MTQDMLLPRDDFQSFVDESATLSAIERRGVENQGGFLTPYYLFELLGRQHEEELGPAGREPSRRLLKYTFRQAMRGWGESQQTLAQTWQLWYGTLFQALGFPGLRRLETPVETTRHGLVPISYAFFLNEQADSEHLLFVDLHPFGTDLDQASYLDPKARRTRWHAEADITREPLSRAIEFALDHNQTRWALLSNGSELRLYRKGGSIARQYLKIDFPALFDNDDDKEWLAFWGLFRLAAFLPASQNTQDAHKISDAEAPRCLLDRVIEESQRHATRIANDLRENMVRAVEALLQGIIDSPVNRHLWQGELLGKRIPDEEQLKALFKETIYLLYRLLFLLYSESRDLLPVGDSFIYRDAYSLEHLREVAERRIIRQEDYDKTYYIQTLRTLFDLLRNGFPHRNPALKDAPNQAKRLTTAAFVISAYNGQLFDPERTALLNTCHIPDRAMREVILELSLSHPKRRGERPERYSYADLGVDQLGSIYEGLLVYEPYIADEAMVDARVKNEIRLIPREQADDLELPYDPEAIKPAGSFLLRIWGGRRKGSGSYYTPQEITAFLVKDALAPLVEPIVEGCTQRNAKGKPLRSAEEILQIKVCDPAMGSGHFLVQACRYLGDAYGRALIAEGRNLKERVTTDDLALYKRRVAEKCLYGVDLNPLAVELAKVSLWLETLARDRPLTFLDAHLRCGNSLIGAPLRGQTGKLDLSRLLFLPTEAYGKATKEDTQQFKDLLKELAAANRKQLKAQAKQLETRQITLMGDADLLQAIADYGQRRAQLEESDEQKSIEEAVALVHYKQELLRETFTSRESQIRRLKQLCDLWCAAWFWPDGASVEVTDTNGVTTQIPLLAPKTIPYYDLGSMIFDLPVLQVPEHADEYLKTARKLAEEEMRFFHWELEFPEVWYDNMTGEPLSNGGFDVIVGNPPWEIIKPNSQEFWSNYLPTFRTLGKQAALKAAQSLRAEPEIDAKWRQYVKEINQRVNVFKQESFYTRQGGGDVNTYKLFLERMARLIRIGGTFSVVVPSGIYTDKNCTALREMIFFQGIPHFVLSVENRKEIFPIHRSTKVVLLSGEKKEGMSKQSGDTPTVASLFLVGKDPTGRDLAPSLAELKTILPEVRRMLFHQPIEVIKKLAPDTFSLLEFKSQREMEVILQIYSNHPLLGNTLADTWNMVTQREFHMTDDSRFFNTRSEGWPLWEGKMIYQFTCDYAPPKYWIDQNAGLTELTRKIAIEDYQASDVWLEEPPKLGCTDFRLVHREVASNTNEVTLIASVLPPHTFVGHTINIFTQWTYLPKPHFTWVKHFDESNKLYLATLLNSFVINFIIRQKVSAHVSMFLLGQLPVPRLSATHPVSQALVPLAARLTCVDERFAPLWEALAQQHSGSMTEQWLPTCVVRDPSERAHLRAEIDARVANLYGLREEDFAYILSTFPLLDRDQPALPGEPKSFITRDLALLALFTLRGKMPPVDIVIFFAKVDIDIHQQTGPLIDLRERVRVATEDLGAVAYMPSGREREESETEEDEQDEFKFDENEE